MMHTKGVLSHSAIRIEPRLEVPRWLPPVTSVLAVVVAFIIGGFVILLAGGHPVPAYEHVAKAAFGSVGVLNDTLVKATPLDPGWTGMRPGVPDEALEHRRRRPALYGGMGSQRGSTFPAGTRKRPSHRCDSCHDDRRFSMRGTLGVHSWIPESKTEGQRDHHNADDELHCLVMGSVLGIRLLERGRISDEPDVPQDCLVTSAS